jgi:hypothetical protein
MTPEEMNAKYGKPPVLPSSKGVTNPFESRWASPNDDFLGSHVSKSYDVGSDGKPIGAFSAGARNFSKSIISNEIGVGQTIGQSAAVLSKDFDEMVKSKEGLSEQQVQTIKMIREKKNLGEDTSRLERVLQKTIGNEKIDINKIAPATQKTNLQAVGELGGIALDIASVGTLKGLKVAKTAAKALQAKKAFRFNRKGHS